MAVNYHPQIVTSGLIMNLDPANIKSYNNSISTTTWYDLSLTKAIGTLNGNVAYSAANNGNLYFGTYSTTTDSITFASNPIPGGYPGLTVEVWGKFNTYSGGSGTYYIIGERNNIFRLMYGVTSFSWAMATTNNAWYSAGTTLSINNVTIGNWNQAVFVYNGTNVLGYLNGNYSSITSVAISGNISAVPVGLYIAQSDVGNVSYAVGAIGNIKIYNRALSSSEITKNFNTLRGRFGV